MHSEGSFDGLAPQAAAFTSFDFTTSPLNNFNKQQNQGVASLYPPPLAFELQDLNPQANWNLSPFSAFQNSIIVNSSTDSSNISSFSELPLNSHTPVHFDSLTGMLVVQGDSQDNILHESISTQGYYELNLDGLLFSSDANSTHYSQELAGATRETVKAFSFNGGLGHDRLILDRQNLNQALHITADDEVDIQGNITSKSDIQITADQINLNAKIKANSVVFNAANVLNQGEIKTKGITDITFSDRYMDTSLSVISGKKISITGGATGNLETRGKFVAKEISLLGNQVSLLGANLDATSKSGGGTVLIGGDYQGKGVERGIVNAMNTVVDKNTVIRADALSNGNGGKVIIWSDQKTIFEGSVSTKGGSESGDGGFVEVSGKHQLNFAGQVDTSATNGKVGTLLLDPTDIYIGPDDQDPDTYDVSDLVQVTGNVILSATNNVTIDTPAYFVDSTGTITLQADSDGNGAGTVILNGVFASGGRNIVISGANVNSSDIYSSNVYGDDLHNVNGMRGGFITITAKNTIVTGDLLTGSYDTGGNITVNSISGSVTLRDLATSSINEAGAIDIRAKIGVTVRNVYSQSLNNIGRTVVIQANDTITSGDIYSRSTQGNAGDIRLTGSRISSATINSGSTNGNAGAIYLTNAGVDTGSGYTISTGSINSSSVNGSGGEIKLSNISNIIGTGKGGNNGITTGDLSSNSTNGSGGAISLSGITVSAGNLRSDSGSGSSGLIQVDSLGRIAVRSLNTTSKRGVAGNVILDAKLGINVRNITTIGNKNGNAGNVTLTAVNDVKALAIKTNINGTGNRLAGNVEIIAGGNIVVDSVRADSVGGVGGNIRLDASKRVRVTNSFNVNATNYSLYTDSVDVGSQSVGASVLIKTQGTVALNQVPFVIGNATVNGTSSAVSDGVATFDTFSGVHLFVKDTKFSNIEIKIPIVLANGSFANLTTDIIEAIGQVIPFVSWFNEDPTGLLLQVYSEVNRLSKVTLQQIIEIAPYPNLQFTQKLMPYLNVAMAIYGINTGIRESHFIAQVTQETGFRSAEEEADGSQYEGDIANLGNTEPGDGKLFKGRGLMQLTGRANYTKFSNYSGLGKTLTILPILVSENLALAALSAGYLWKVHYGSDFNLQADKDIGTNSEEVLRYITQKINGGLAEEEPTYLRRRREYLASAKRVLIK
jgi:predicted chitinase